MSKQMQRGAAMVESVLIIAVMVILLVAIPKLAKYQDVRQTTVDASRYATWQMTVSETADREKIIDRMFSRPDAAIRSQNTELDNNPFWRSSQRPLIRDQAFTPVQSSAAQTNQNNAIDSFVDVRSVTLKTVENSTSAGVTANAITGTVRTVSDWLGDSDAIASNRGIVQSNVSVAVNQSSEGEATTMNCGFNDIQCLSVSSSMLVDGWEAADLSSVERGAQVMVPTQLLKPIGRALSLVSVVPLLKEFKEIDDSFGCVNSRVLPTKELSGDLAGVVGASHVCQ